MDKYELIDLFNLLNDRDIVCFIYTRILNCQHKDLAQFRDLSMSQIKKSSSRINKKLDHDDIVAALQAVFCDFMDRE